MLQSQFTNVQFSFLLFFQSMYCLFYWKCLFFLSFFSPYAVFNNVQVSLSFFFTFCFFLFLHFHCPVAFCFWYSFLFSFFFFYNKLLIQCPLFLTLYLPLSLYLNTITIGSLPSLFNFSLYYHKLSLIYNTTFSIAYEHSSSFFFFSQNIPGFFFLNNPNFYQFCRHFPIQNISESANLRHTWFRQNSAHLLITSKTLFQNIFPNNNLKASLQGELTKYLSASSDTKNHLSLSYSASTARPFSIHMDHDKSETIPMSPIIAINNFHRKQPAWFYQRRKYRFSQLHKYRKIICALFRQTTNLRNSWTIPLMLPGLHFSD